EGGGQEYEYPPKVGATIHLVGSEVVGDRHWDNFTPEEGGGIGTLTSCYEGFKDSVGLGVISKATMAKVGVERLEELEGKVVYAGGGIGVIESTGHPDFAEIEDEEEGEGGEEVDEEEVERAEKEAREAMERLEKLKAKAEMAMKRRKKAKADKKE
ncbi:hypothetical protein TrRE_jg1885, partial [Triparma retinervis]